MGSDWTVFIPFLVVFALLGLVLGGLAFWGWLSLRRQLLGGSTTLAGAQAETLQAVQSLGRRQTELEGALRVLQGAAITSVVVQTYNNVTDDPTATPNSALVALTDERGNGALIHVYGTPTTRVLPLENNTCRVSGGLQDRERSFIKRLGSP